MNSANPIPRRLFAIAILLGGAASIALGSLAALSVINSGGGAVLSAIIAVLVLGVALACIPLLGPPLVTPDRWGMVVLLVSGTRTLVAMGAMMFLIQIQGLDRKPVVYGVLVGTVTMMIVESAVAVAILVRRERLRNLSVAQRSAQ